MHYGMEVARLTLAAGEPRRTYDFTGTGSASSHFSARKWPAGNYYGPTLALIVTSHDPSAFCVAANMPPDKAPLIAPSTGAGTGAGAAHCR